MRWFSIALLLLAAPWALAVDMLKPATDVMIQRQGQTLSFPTAKEAVAAAKDGDVILLGPGTHAGTLAIAASGITLRGQAGARISANTLEWKPQWTPEPDYGPHAFSSPIPFEPVTVAIDQRVMINITETRGGPGVHIRGVGRAGRIALQGMFTYQSKTKRLIVSFAQKLDPAQHLIEAAPEGASAVLIKGADNVSVENLIITGGRAGVAMLDTKNSTVQHCLIYGTDVCVSIGRGASSCKALSNDLTWNADALSRDCDPPTVPRDIWMAHKHSGTYDKHGVMIEAAGENNEIAYNYVYNIWDGIEAGDGVDKNDIATYYQEKVFKGISQFNRGLKVHHNRIDLAADDAMRPGGELVDNQWYSNIVTRGGDATRLSTISMGPFFFYDNLLLQCGDGMRLYKSSPESAQVFIVNNTIQHPGGIIYHQVDSVAWNDPWLMKNLPKGTPGFHLYNNLFVCDTHFTAVESGSVKPNFKADYNVYTSSANKDLLARGIDAHSVFDAKVKFLDAAKGDYQLAEGSDGTGAGVDLATLGLSLPLPPALTGRKPNAGILGIDAAKTPHGPVSGLWDLAAAQFSLGERDDTQYSLEPSRWVMTKHATFILKDLPAAETMTVLVDRSGATDKVNYKVTVRDDQGRELASQSGSKLADKEGFSVDVKPNGAKELRVEIDDTGENRYWVSAKGCTSGIDTAGQPLRIEKGDGGRYIFDYPVAADVPAFTVKSASTVEIARPGGKPEPLDKSGRVVTNGQAGVYQILVQFVKKAELTIDGPQTTVFFDKQQETVPLQRQWGRPQF
jgi:hypothetical protein